ncbi:MarR family winged helix-turn-helix transcriptional regulator [Microbulbifer spongiae]|uniref:MarR family transcriptional regulator n=1 Tax=Microbulbifer spongiae TaxID=2944933 RepID=A0ABY9EE33_9GAMM|nr:MarR family transcriptional regulator [Microbulbifer sp. MI-G]WKD49804.1 MarR family transcriptional regulator [Microbulbifer sp. MI-G]
MKNIKPPSSDKLTQIEAAHQILLQGIQLRQKLNTALLEKCDITLSEKELLAKVYMSGEQIRMSDVSKTLMFTEGGATKIIKRLADRGFVTRQQSEHDGRVFLIDITNSGAEKLADALQTMESVAYPLMKETLTTKECETLTKLLKKLNANALGA